MPLRIGDLLLIIEANKIRLPKTGTGRGNQIVARDLETAIGDHFLARDYIKGSDKYKHMVLRRSWTPMKAYRFNQLKPLDQDAVLADNNEWIAEKKFNGWRMMVTFVPGTTPRFWSGNLSTVNFLPTDYTEHILLKQGLTPYTTPYRATEKLFTNMLKSESILDCEVTVKDDDGELSDHASLIRVQEILGSNVDRAIMLQKDATLLFHVFDRINPGYPNQPLLQRKTEAAIDCHILAMPTENALWQFEQVNYQANNKKALAHKIWKAGGEGIILKHTLSIYTPGSRLRTHQIKVKRSHSDAVGDDIDAFITGVYRTPEWDKIGLIGGVELSLYLKTVTSNGEDLKEHIIANVTSIPDSIREAITEDPDIWLNKVVVCDGQDLSARNQRLLHAKVDWKRGIRKDKLHRDCVMEIEEIEGVKF